MPFVLSEFREEDCTEFAILDEAASQGWPLARAMEQGMESRQEMFEQWFHGKFGKQTDLKWVKVVDDASGEMAAGALWQFATQPTKPTPSTQSTVVGKGKHGEFEVAGVPPVFEAMGRGWQEFRDEYIPDQPYANLQVLVTHPKYQRKGAGSMLIQYGCDVADSKCVPCVLTASEVGLSLYTKHGFELKSTNPLDLRPYGVEATEMRRRMVRPAKK